VVGHVANDLTVICKPKKAFRVVWLCDTGWLCDVGSGKFQLKTTFRFPVRSQNWRVQLMIENNLFLEAQTSLVCSIVAIRTNHITRELLCDTSQLAQINPCLFQS